MINRELINPQSIVIVGGSNNVQKPGGRLVRNLLDGKYKDFKTLNRDLIKPCVDELNKKSDLAVTVETIKKGRTVVALHFRFKEDKQIKMTI